MTIASTTSKVSYNGSGSTGPFPVTFRFAKNADIVATHVSSADVETVLALTTDYTLTGAGEASGGALTLTTALAVGAKLVISRSPAILQEVDYVENSAFPAETHEAALDLLTMICQDLDEKISRAVLVGIGSGSSPEDLLDELSADVAAAAASAATATTQAGLADTARIAAEAAAASVPTFGAFGITLAGTETASNARAEMELGGAALLEVGTTAGTVCAGDDARLDTAGGAAAARNLAIRNAIRLGILAADAAGVIPGGYLDVFVADSLATKTNATYDASGDYYTNGGYGLDLCTGGTPSVQTATFSGTAANIVDNNPSTVWQSNVANQGTFRYVFSSAKTIRRVTINPVIDANSGAPESFTVQVSADGSTGYATVATFTGQSFTDGVVKTFDFANSTSGLGFQVVPSACTSGKGCGLREVECMEAVAVDMVLIPIALTTGSSTTAFDGYYLHKAIDATTLNTDIIAAGTANGGTNWTNGTSEVLCAYDSEWNYIRVPFTGLTAGTSVAMRLTTANAKAQRVKAIAELLAG